MPSKTRRTGSKTLTSCKLNECSRLLRLYTDFIKAKINFYQILPCVNYLCTMARSPFVLKHITRHKYTQYIHQACMCIQHTIYALRRSHDAHVYVYMNEHVCLHTKLCIPVMYFCIDTGSIFLHSIILYPAEIFQPNQ